MRSQLLVSVRDADEAGIALAAGAHLIDVKEPALGALGKADDTVIQDVIDRVGNRVPVSAALGEWDEGHTCPAALRLAFVKWGPARAARRANAWRSFVQVRGESTPRAIDVLARHPEPPSPQPSPPGVPEGEGAIDSGFATGSKPVPAQVVIVAYADWQCAQAPPVEAVADLACRHAGSVLLLDTHCKDARSLGWSRRPSLLDWQSPAELDRLIGRCRQHQVRVALAGSLDQQAIERLLPLVPDWFAVRGAVCAQDDRRAGICAARVRSLVKMLGN